MEKTKVKEFVLKISGLWNEQKKREVIYLEALKKDNMSSLRKLLVQGHFNALLCQKEILSIYDYFKCLLTDKELGKLNKADLDYIGLQKDIQNVNEKEQIVGILKKSEGAILHSYKSLTKHLDDDSEARRILNNHLDRISEFYEILSKQESSIRKNKPVSVSSD